MLEKEFICGHRFLIAWMTWLLVGLMASAFGVSIASAQDLYPVGNLGPPYLVHDYLNPVLKFQSIGGALAAAKLDLMNDIGQPIPGCPVLSKLVTYPPQISEGEVAEAGFPSSCSVGMVYGAGVGATKYKYDVGKNAGGCSCDGGNGHSGGPDPGSSLKSYPINIATGNKYEQETEYTAPDDELTLRRFYNSQSGYQPTALGSLWRHSFDRWLQPLESNFPVYPPYIAYREMRSFRPDGHFILFRQINGVWRPDADVADTLTEQDSAGAPVSYKLFVAAKRETEKYSAASGLLQSITSQSGDLAPEFRTLD